MKIQTKTALLFTILTAGIILLLNVVIYFFSSKFAFADFYKRLEIRAFVAARMQFERNETSADAYENLRLQHLEKLEDEKEYFVNADSINTATTLLPMVFYNTVKIQGVANYNSNNIYYTGVLYEGTKQKHIVIVSATNEYGSHLMSNLGRILTGVFFFAVILIFTVGFLFSKRTFEPFRKIILNVKNINANNLSLRLENNNGKDEIAELSSTFNDMLDRLEVAFESQNNFVSNASHEIRTPITSIMGEAELALLKPRNEEEYRNTLGIIFNQGEKLKNITNSLLMLAQLGFNGKKEEWRLVRMDEKILQAKATIDEINPQNKINIDFTDLPEDESMMQVNGNAQLIKLALNNIMHNACKYSNNDEVEVKIWSTGSQVHVRVSDKGIGIPAADLKHIYDPFFRASNTGKYIGHGIGLPLSMHIIRHHKGIIEITSKEGAGTTVELIIPVA